MGRVRTSFVFVHRLTDSLKNEKKKGIDVWEQYLYNKDVFAKRNNDGEITLELGRGCTHGSPGKTSR
jgi:hypothetical protein